MGAKEAVYVLHKDAVGEWAEVRKLTGDAPESDDEFGQALSVSGTTALVGAHGDDDRGVQGGAAYLFQRDEAHDWQETAKLVAPDGTENNRFGFAVSIDGDTALIGSPWDDATWCYVLLIYFKESRASRNLITFLVS